MGRAPGRQAPLPSLRGAPHRLRVSLPDRHLRLPSRSRRSRCRQLRPKARSLLPRWTTACRLISLFRIPRRWNCGCLIRSFQRHHHRPLLQHKPARGRRSSRHVAMARIKLHCPRRSPLTLPTPQGATRTNRRSWSSGRVRLQGRRIHRPSTLIQAEFGTNRGGSRCASTSTLPDASSMSAWIALPASRPSMRPRFRLRDVGGSSPLCATAGPLRQSRRENSSSFWRGHADGETGHHCHAWRRRWRNVAG